MDSYSATARENAAADAAGLLLRIGFGILVLAAPFAALFSRRSFVILVPVGVFLIVVAALLVDARDYGARIRSMIASSTGLVVLGLAFWLFASLAWTPFPASAGERALRTFGNGAMAALACAALPARMRSSNLNLMIIGIALASIALVIGAVLSPAALNFVAIGEGPTFARSAIAASVLVWPALCWTMTRGRDIEGILLVAACGIAAIASASLAASLVLFTALLVFLIARARPRAASRVLSWGWALTLLLAPVMPFVARSIALAAGLAPGHVLSQIGLWADVISRDPARLLTGHGFDTMHRARASGLFDRDAPLGMLPEVWYDLGILGAIGLAFAVYFGLRALRRAPRHVAASAMALLSAVLMFLVIDSTATQQWWLSVCVVAAVTMTAVHHGQYKTRRPSATLAWPRLGRNIDGMLPNRER